MLSNFFRLIEYFTQLEDFVTPISDSIKKSLAEAFENNCLKAHKQVRR
ncbi:hypothetical protein MTBBW1_750015 [Desulfamplus magnetovallimortis]|uniref:Uncharacterized protein n=1 Tax=Desulfamplus magnetovallimortis TaxID=1246637 RepID=A0A1W1HJ60_9BACT|nr:hypothetical protein MTBBW1_750015 [Desulfamplus magnetovallimortis]